MLNLTKRKFYYRRMTCRVCGSKSLKKFLDLGRMPLADSFLTKNQFRKELFFPLATYLCSACNLIQLLDVVHWKLIFPDEYAFFSSASPAAVKHFTDYAQEISNRFNRSTNKFIVEIASNDGVLLKPLQEKGFRVLGIDPATNVAQIAQGRGIETFIEFFNEKLSKKVVKKYGQANVVLANNVLAHVDEPRDFIRGVKRLLDPSGAFIFEVQYGFDLIGHTEFDNIYHEHRSFFTVRPLKVLLEKEGMKLFNIEHVSMQGGSLRCYATHKENKIYPITNTIDDLINREIDNKFNTLKPYTDFAKRVFHLKKELINTLKEIKLQNKRIIGYGAPAKSTTLLNFCDIGSDIIDYCIEKTPFKYDKFTPGKHIPIVSDERIKKDGFPDYYLLLIWNYQDAIFKQEKKYRRQGGKFIIPIPHPIIL